MKITSKKKTELNQTGIVAHSIRKKGVLKSHKKKLGVILFVLISVSLAAYLVVHYRNDQTSVGQVEVPATELERSSRASEHFASDNPKVALAMYDQLIESTENNDEKADYLAERALALSIEDFDHYKDQILKDSIEADRLRPTAVSARLVESFASKAGDSSLEKKYRTLYEERADPNVRPE